ncbi:DUF1934 domain-containing protein [Fonticella tunisiensis]|uniref:Uncharacterized beta-barrel protein YwiB (DUF1934 family) n=1 Tax=Fonticella tunisiensis TaxID=1096341 RepID=A0A4R7KVF1_9CLOT|nr:DUF1934 domain-containing protein [Fonticella tunisiensis]TDT62353.1 uncharacterized beta-barrel protein YwiB (DUF1934 family) [Fonticella tunisiensis]
MDNKVLISVKTLQYIDGQPEEIELITEGRYYKEGDHFFAEYEESEISGMEGTKTTVKIEDDSLIITRRGTTNSSLVFKKGLNHKSLYSTPYGALEVVIKPRKVLIDVNEAGGNVKLEYRMEASGFESIENALELNIKRIN